MKRLIALGLALLVQPAFAAPRPAARAIAGEWRGTYVCGQGLTGLHLTIGSAPSGRLKALFDFGPVKENPLVPHGRYNMSGTFDRGTGRLHLNAGKWITQPVGYFTVDLDGYLGAAGDQITGVVPAAGCTVFDLRRQTALVG